MNLGQRDESAWDKGDLAYDLGDTLDIGMAKAAREGIKPCSNEYAAFMTAFGRRMRMKQVSPKKQAINLMDLSQIAPPQDGMRAPT